MKNKITVIGSGISGLSIAKMLRETHTVYVLEKNDEIGGLIKCKRVNGNLFHLVGGHVFNSRNQTVMEWFWQFFDRDNEFLKATRNARILLEDKVIGYPIENYLYQLSTDKIQCITRELLHIAATEIDPRKADDFETFLKKSFGETLFKIYFGPYNYKIWNTDLSKIPLEWLDDKLPMPAIEEIFINNIAKQKDTSTVHATFYYPVRDGSQFIVNRLAEGLNIQRSYEVKSVAIREKKIQLNGEHIETDALVYCGDVRRLHEIIQINDNELSEALKAVKTLPANGTTNVLCECDENDISWLYLPENKFKAHRIIYTGNFSETNNNPTGRKTCVVEYSGKHEIDDIRKELPSLPGNLQEISFNYEPNSYIIHRVDTRKKIRTIKTLLEKYNIYLLGRFSEWEYHNMDKCIESAMELHATLCKQQFQ
ncbi:MAG: FAD-dependent oxidoreductase [Bacteroidota bacterium]